MSVLLMRFSIYNAWRNEKKQLFYRSKTLLLSSRPDNGVMSYTEVLYIYKGQVHWP